MNKTDELLKLTGPELLTNTRVRAAWYGLYGPCEFDTGYWSVADVAFAMRDAMFDWPESPWYRNMRSLATSMWPDSYDTWIMESSKSETVSFGSLITPTKPEHWIVAAVLAWEAKTVEKEMTE